MRRKVIKFKTNPYGAYKLPKLGYDFKFRFNPEKPVYTAKVVMNEQKTVRIK
jgi:hypothetical protein